ncbi:hypothetical protein [Streptomyces sp. NBC_00525]|uniref:hypothetical protein n=1 Tax=Streptomyces sp. NBC_00525 TaxID=2903660 RepID=UPI002E81D989|nr:hypothetical protein [Streptomyces sp. NBC_00525]WUC96303.1 hypothetical protein OG710_23070 [Streptomyces sp. NBC_00525]
MTDTAEPGGLPPWCRAAAAARNHGLPTALEDLRAEVCPDRVPHGPAGHVALPTRMLESEEGAARSTTVLSTPDGAIRFGRLASATSGAAEATGGAWDLGLVWVRLGQSCRLLDACLEYLRGRTVGGAALLMQQMVKGGLADAKADQLTVETLISGAEPGELSEATLAYAHDTLTGCDRALLRLLGAFGYRADGPGACAHASALVADAYVRRPDPEEVAA